ncbi:hypothetical protein ACU5DF_23880 [Aliivibrio wodanis]|uniref:hypothetical protein n=1 Tax=Aliivibrio wodanis TaxID=80852 RepID=UPI00406CDD47
MGTRVWEPLAKAFSASNGFEVLDEKQFNKRVPVIPDDLTAFISLWEKRKLSDMSLLLSGYWIELSKFIAENVELEQLGFQKMPKGQGVDILLRKDER